MSLNIFYLTVSFKVINFNFQMFLPFVPEMSTSFTRLTLFRLCTLLWFGSCNRCILTCFLYSKKVNILHQTMVYAVSIHIDLDSP